MNKAQEALASPLDKVTVVDQRRKPERQVGWLIEEDGTVIPTRPLRPPRAVKLNAETQNVMIDLAKSAVIVVDMQNDFFRIAADARISDR